MSKQYILLNIKLDPETNRSAQIKVFPTSNPQELTEKCLKKYNLP